MSFVGMLLKAGINVAAGGGSKSMTLTGSATSALDLGGTNTNAIYMDGTATYGIRMSANSITNPVYLTKTETGISGTVRDVNVEHINGADSMSKIIEALRVSIASEYYTGNWVNAIIGRIDYGDAGDARGGMAAAICAEMNMPAKSYASIGGPCYSLDCEFNCPTNFVAGDRVTYPIAFMKFGLWGGAKTQFDSEGYLFHTDGLTAGSGGLLSANSRTLRVNIEGTDKYIYLSDTENDLGAMYVDSMTVSPASAVGMTISGTPTKLIAAGSYASPLTQPTGSTMEAITVSITDTEDDFLIGQGIYLQGTGTDGKLFGNCVYLEYKATGGTDRMNGCQMMAFLGTIGGSEAARLKTLGGDATAGMYAGWFKVGANTNCVVDSGSRVAPLWIDNQMNCVCSGEEYAMFITCGGSKVDAVMGFETTSSGWTNFLYFDETAYDQDPVSANGCNVSGAGASEAYLKVSLNGTAYGIPLIAI